MRSPVPVIMRENCKIGMYKSINIQFAIKSLAIFGLFLSQFESADPEKYVPKPNHRKLIDSWINVPATFGKYLKLNCLSASRINSFEFEIVT